MSESKDVAQVAIQRWTKPEELSSHRMVEHSLGEWVHWKDHAAEVERLRAGIEKANRWADALCAPPSAR